MSPEPLDPEVFALLDALREAMQWAPDDVREHAERLLVQHGWTDDAEAMGARLLAWDERQDEDVRDVLDTFTSGRPLFSQRLLLERAAGGEAIDVKPGSSGVGLRIRGIVDGNGRITPLGRRVAEHERARLARPATPPTPQP